MPDNRNRKRPIQVKFFVDERELDLIKTKMVQLGIEDMSAYLRKCTYTCCACYFLFSMLVSVISQMEIDGNRRLVCQKAKRTLSMAA